MKKYADIQGNLTIIKKLLPGIFIFVLFIPLAYSAVYPTESLNPYYNALASFLNTSLDSTTGQLWKGLNASFYDFNISNNLIVLGNINATIINGTQILIGGKPVQASEDFNLGNISNYTQYIRSTDFNLGNISNYTQYIRSVDFNLGNISNTTSWSSIINIPPFFNYANITEFFGDANFNSSVLRESNLTTVLSDARIPNDLTIQTTNNLLIGGGFASGGITLQTSGDLYMNGSLYVIGNISSLDVSNLNINGSLFPSLDAFFDLGNNLLRWRNANFTGTLQSANLVAGTNVLTANILDIDSSNFFDLTGCGTGATFTALDSTGAITCSAISITESQISNLGVYIRSADFNLGNISNYTQYIKSVDFNLGNISNYTQYIQSKDFNLGNISNNTINPPQLDNNTIIRVGNLTNVNVSNATYASKVNCAGIYGGSDSDFCVDASGSINTNDLDIVNRTILDNATIIRTSNLTALNTLDQYVQIGDFNLGNISNYSQFIQSKDFNLGNITNDTIGLSKLNNATIVRLNQSAGQSGNLNITGNLTFIGSINATGLTGILNCNQLSGGTDADFCIDADSGAINTNNLAITNTSMFDNNTIVRAGNITYVTSQAVGGETSGTIASITLSNTALDDQYMKLGSFNLGNISNYTQYIQSKDFNLGNISNYTQYIRSTDFNLGNISNNTINRNQLNNNTILRVNQTWMHGNINLTGNITLIGDINATGLSGLINCNQLSGGSDANFCVDADSGAINTNDLAIANVSMLDNNTIIRVGNLTTLNTLNIYIKSVDFNLGNISNYTQYIRSTDFNLGNITNDTISKSANISIALWNISEIYLFPRVSTHLVRIGNPNTNLSNDTFVVMGSASIYGTLNATFINASRILLGTKPVQVSSDFNLGNISNYTQYTLSTNFNLGNISNYTQYIRSTDFNLGNISNNTINSPQFGNNTIVRINTTKIMVGNINITGNITISLNYSLILAHAIDRRITANETCVTIIAPTSVLSIC